MEESYSCTKSQVETMLGTLEKWVFRLAGIALALSAMTWANESTLQSADILNSALAFLVVLLIYGSEIMLVREANVPINPITLGINGVVIFFPLMNIAVFSWPLAVIFIALGIIIAGFIIRGKSFLLQGQKTLQ